jgi:hypothetical protein
MRNLSLLSESPTALQSLDSESESESELLYDWLFTANQFVLVPSPLRLTARIFFSIQHLRSQFLYNILSDGRIGLSFTFAAGPRQHIHSRIRVPRTRDHILLSQIRDIPFCRLLLLAGLRWRYSTTPPHGNTLESIICSRI